MTDKNYYKKILSLYEESKHEIDDGSAEEVYEQDPVANEPMRKIIPGQPQEPEYDEGYEGEDLEDGDYLDGDFPEMEPVDEDIPGREKLQRANMYELYDELRKQVGAFTQNLDEINYDRLDEGKILRIRDYNKKIKDISDKIDKHIEFNIKEDDLDQNRYIYVALRTEFTMLVDLVRRTLRIKEYQKSKKSPKISRK